MIKYQTFLEFIHWCLKFILSFEFGILFLYPKPSTLYPSQKLIS